MHKSSIVYTQKQFKTNMWVDFDVRGKQGMKHYYGLYILARNNGLGVKTP